MPAPASVRQRLVITGCCSLALFGAFMTVAYGELTDQDWDSLGDWIMLLLITCLFGIAQLVLMIVLAANRRAVNSPFIQVFSMHNTVWFLSLFVFTIIVDNVDEVSLIFALGILVSVASLLIILVREKEERKDDPNLTDF